MRIFALETDIEKLKKKLLSPGEKEIFTVRFHGLRFLVRFIVHAFLTLLLLFLCGVIISTGVEVPWVMIFGWGVWLLFILPRMAAAYVDWRYDVLILTKDKIIHVDQSSIVRARIRQMNLENIAAVHAETQHLNMFPFGKICFDLKEGVGQQFCLSYIPNATETATKIAQTVAEFQKRKEFGYTAK